MSLVKTVSQWWFHGKQWSQWWFHDKQWSRDIKQWSRVISVISDLPSEESLWKSVISGFSVKTVILRVLGQNCDITGFRTNTE